MQASAGLACWAEPTDPVARVVALGSGGAGASRFRQWLNIWPRDLALYAVRLPGRESRSEETPLDTMDGVVADIGRHLVGGDPSVVLFGLCSGALVMHEVAHVMQAAGNAPAGVIVASQTAPSHTLESTPRQVSPPAIVNFLREEGRTPEALLARDGFLDLMVPVIGAELQMLNTYRYVREQPLTCPLWSVRGSGDEAIQPDTLKDWAAETTGPYRDLTIPGDHLFFDAWEGLGRAVGEAALTAARAALS